ncbi:MAG: hypothetical protein NZ651_04385 [Candidatus Bipolaricaulota bacterium]|nr:hypothetical protein [Candidatus Bipolaricaulota bacterium]MDW8126989.1 hypothetical protein [Candidatus Bipolaricaulota bacterium]
MSALSQSVSVEISKRKEIFFPKLCPRCLQPAGPTVELRSFYYAGLATHITKVSVPICKNCWRAIMPKHLLLVLVFGWGFLALGFFLVAHLQNGWGVATFFLCLLISRVIRDLNPLGVEFRESKDGYIWTFPNPVYAQLFADLNSGQVLAELPAPSHRAER